MFDTTRWLPLTNCKHCVRQAIVALEILGSEAAVAVKYIVRGFLTEGDCKRLVGVDPDRLAGLKPHGFEWKPAG